MRHTESLLVSLAATLFIAGCASQAGDANSSGLTDDAGAESGSGEDAPSAIDGGAPVEASTDAHPSGDAGKDASGDGGSAGDGGPSNDGGGSNDGGPPPITCGILKPGQELVQGQQVDACNDEGFGKMSLVMQTDGNLVLYQNDVCQQPTWASNTYQKGGYRAAMQTDGNFVLYTSSGTPLWASNTNGNPGAYLGIQGDGNLVVYTSANKPIWASNTYHVKPTHKLWIAQDGATSNSGLETYWRIVLEMSLNFTKMEANWSTGRPMALGGYKVLGSPCSVVHPTSATVSDDSATLQCIENQTGWNIGSDDVILYFPQGYGCQDGRNHWHIPVSHGGGNYSLEAAFAFTGAGATCQEAIGSHEVYEATSDASSADCCNGQDGCPATPGAYGWYSFSKCGSTWEAQAVAPSAADEYTASACTELQF